MIIEYDEERTADEQQLPHTIQQVIAADQAHQQQSGKRREKSPFTRPTDSGWEKLWPIWLGIILLLGAWMRFDGINWDQFTHLHPDERFLTIVASSLETESSPLAYLRTSESTLNPYNKGQGFYVYGNFPMTVTRYVAEMGQGFCGADGCEAFGKPVNYTGYDGIHLVGRALSALIDLVAVAFTFLIGRRLYGTKVGLLGTFLVAFSVLSIQQSHFFTADNWASALCVIALYMAVRASEHNQMKWYALFGLFLGLSVASRINMAPLAAIAGVSAFVWLSRHFYSWQDAISSEHLFDLFTRAAMGVALAAVVSFVTFRLAMPYAFNDVSMAKAEAAASYQEGCSERGEICAPRTADDYRALSSTVILRTLIGFNDKWEQNMEEIQRLQKPDAMFPPAIQWTDRTAVVFPLTNMVFWGMGLLAGIAALAGCAWAFMRISRARPEWRAHMIPVLWSLAYFLFMGTRWVKSVRYFLPIYSTLLLLAAWALFALMAWAGRNRLRRFLAMSTMMLVMMGTMMWANAFMAVYRDGFTRVRASEWIFEHVPSAVTLLYEADGDERQLQLPIRAHEFWENGPILFSTADLPHTGTVTAVRFNYVTSDSPADMTLTLGTPAQRQLYGGTQINIEGGLEREAVLFDVTNFEVTADTQIALEFNMTTGGNIALDTSAVVSEHWDDPLPVNLDGRNAYGSYYRGIKDPDRGVDGTIPITGQDDANKLEGFVSWLDKADYVMLSSQRAVWTTPRMPIMFPMTIEYFESLFNGDLGFEMVQQTHADMNIGPLYISDTGGSVHWGSPPAVGWPPPPDFTAAEEAFSVYDHPPVWIFQKSDTYSSDATRDLLGSVDLSAVSGMNPGQATKAGDGLVMTSSEFAAQQAGGTFSELFNPDGLLNNNAPVAVIVWWLAVVLIGLLAFPFTFTVLNGLPTKGYAFSRMLGILVVSYFGWLMASLRVLPNTRPTYLLGLAILVVLSAIQFARKRAEIGDWWRERRNYVLAAELVALSLFGFFLCIRLLNPDVWHVIWGGEKPMDMTYFTAVLKSSYFPPYDPWYAGGKLNYYYYGFVYVGVLPKLLGIVPAVAYNLILPMLFSFTGTGAFAVTYNLMVWRGQKEPRDLHHRGDTVNRVPTTHRAAVLAGIAAMTLCVLLGNLGEVRVIATAWTRAGDSSLNPNQNMLGAIQQAVDGGLSLIGERTAPISTGDWFWTASRSIIVPDGEIGPITEFPYFTFLYGDLHAHMISLPLTLLALAWVVSFALRPLERNRAKIETALIWFTGALAIGVLYPTNSWDFPTYMVLGILGVVLFNLRKHGTLSLGLIGDTAIQTAVLVGMSLLLFVPFSNNFGAGFSEIARWEGSVTGLGSYFTVWGLFLLLISIHLVRECRAWVAAHDVLALEKLERSLPFLLGGAVALFGMAAVLAYAMLPIMLIALPMVVIAGMLALSPILPVSRRIALALISSAFALTLFVDIFVIEGTVGRMNTVFKFYMQVWVLLSVVGGMAFAGIMQSLGRWGITRRVLWWLAFVPLLLVAFSYVPLATRAKMQERMSQDVPLTIDGMAFLPYAQYGDSGQQVSLEADYEAFRWMQRNIDGSPVIAEAYSGNYYRAAGNRVAMYTGSSSIIGWGGHQGQQRAAAPNSRIQERIRDVETLYNTVDETAAQELLQKYDVGYVYVGTLEAVYYAPDGLAKFGRMAQNGDLRVIYNEQDVTIYQVID